MRIVSDFYNKLKNEISKTYFTTVGYYRDNEDLAKASYAIELFNNGCMTYRVLINRLKKLCSSNKNDIEKIVDKYVIKTEE